MVPQKLLADSISDIAKVVRLGQWAAVIKTARGRRASFAGMNPFLVMAKTFGNERFGPFEVLELLLGQQDVLAVIRQ